MMRRFLEKKYVQVSKEAFTNALLKLRTEERRTAVIVAHHADKLLIETLRQLMDFFEKNPDQIRTGKVGDEEFLRILKTQLNNCILTTPEKVKTIRENLEKIQPGFFNRGLIYQTFAYTFVRPDFQPLLRWSGDEIKGIKSSDGQSFYIPTIGVRTLLQLKTHSTALRKINERLNDQESNQMVERFDHDIAQFRDGLQKTILDPVKPGKQWHDAVILNSQLIDWALPRLIIIEREVVTALSTLNSQFCGEINRFKKILKELEETRATLKKIQNLLLEFLLSKYKTASIAQDVKLEEKTAGELAKKVVVRVIPMASTGVQVVRLSKMLNESSKEVMEWLKSSAEVGEGLETLFQVPLHRFNEWYEEYTGDISPKEGYQRIKRYFPSEGGKQLIQILSYRLVETYEDAFVCLDPPSRLKFLFFLMQWVITFMKERVISEDVRQGTDDGFADQVLIWLSNINGLVEPREEDGKLSQCYPDEKLKLTDGPEVKASELLSKAGLLCQDATGRVFRFFQSGQNPNRYGFRLALYYEVAGLNDHIKKKLEQPEISEQEVVMRIYFIDDLNHYRTPFFQISRFKITKKEQMEERLERIEFSKKQIENLSKEVGELKKENHDLKDDLKNTQERLTTVTGHLEIHYDEMERAQQENRHPNVEMLRRHLQKVKAVVEQMSNSKEATASKSRVLSEPRKPTAEQLGVVGIHQAKHHNCISQKTDDNRQNYLGLRKGFLNST